MMLMVLLASAALGAGNGIENAEGISDKVPWYCELYYEYDDCKFAMQKYGQGGWT